MQTIIVDLCILIFHSVCKNLIKLIMSSKAPRIKLGVLNMTICFDNPKSKGRISKEPLPSPATAQLATFIPKYGSQRHKSPLGKPQAKMSPYQHYRNHKNESIRYLRQQEEELRESYKNIVGFCSINHRIQLQFLDKKQEQQHNYTPNNFVPDNHLKGVFNKKHLRNTIELQNQRVKNNSRLVFNIKTNPQENLKTIFTARAAQTSQRRRVKKNIEMPYKQVNLNSKNSWTHRQNRSKSNPYREENQARIIRPWSTSKNFQTKLSMFQSDILVGNNQCIQNQRRL